MAELVLDDYHYYYEEVKPHRSLPEHKHRFIDVYDIRVFSCYFDYLLEILSR